MKRIKISFRGYNHSICFKGLWEKEESGISQFREFHLGMVFNRMVGLERSHSGKEIASYMIGINLLVIRIWTIISVPRWIGSETISK